MLHEALDGQHPGWKLRAIQRRAVRKEEAYADHYIAHNLMPALRKHQRR